MEESASSWIDSPPLNERFFSTFSSRDYECLFLICSLLNNRSYSHSIILLENLNGSPCVPVSDKFREISVILVVFSLQSALHSIFCISVSAL